MPIQIQLEGDEALVLFELLASGRLGDSVDDAEGHALGCLLAKLEEQLVEPFAENYVNLLAAAKDSLVHRFGAA
jgi:hypothetical protein